MKTKQKIHNNNNKNNGGDGDNNKHKDKQETKTTKTTHNVKRDEQNETVITKNRKPIRR